MAEGCNNGKKIRVRKASSTSLDSQKSKRNYEEDYYIPLAAQDSHWRGINLKEFVENTEHIRGTSEEEIEIRVINLEQEGTLPLLLLFPDLRNEDSQSRLLTGQMSTSSLTKLLKGRKPKLELLKPSKKLACKQNNLNSVQEVSESEEDKVCVVADFNIAYSTSNDADISSESIENVTKKKKVQNEKMLTKAERDLIYEQSKSKRVESMNIKK